MTTQEGGGDGEKTELSEEEWEGITECVDRVRLHLSPFFTEKAAVDLDDQLQGLRTFLQQTLEQGVSHSALLVGRRGTGKSLVLSLVLKELREKYGAESFATVNLHGQLHADQRAALLQIKHQLLEEEEDARFQLPSEEEDEQRKHKKKQKPKEGNEDDTAATITTKSKTEAELTDKETAFEEATFFGALLDALVDLWEERHKVKKKPIVFVLDDFEQFALTHRQTILYSFLDQMHKDKATIAIIGISSLLDVSDRLEKRVQSRFCKREIGFFPLDKVEKVQAALKQVLFMPVQQERHAEPSSLPISTPSSYPTSTLPFLSSHIATRWNKNVNTIFDDPEFLNLLSDVLDLWQDLPFFYNLVHAAVLRLSPTHPYLTVEDFKAAYAHLGGDPKLQLLKGLSVLEICLVIAMMKFEEDGKENYNFGKAYSEVKAFANENYPSVSAAPKHVALAAFEKLMQLELVQEYGKQGKGVGQEERVVRLTVRPSQVKQALSEEDRFPTSIHTWGIKWVE